MGYNRDTAKEWGNAAAASEAEAANANTWKQRLFWGATIAALGSAYLVAAPELEKLFSIDLPTLDLSEYFNNILLGSFITLVAAGYAGFLYKRMSARRAEDLARSNRKREAVWNSLADDAGEPK